MSVCKVTLPYALKSLKGLGTWELQHTETVSVLPSAEFSASTTGLTAQDCLWTEVGEKEAGRESRRKGQGGENTAPQEHTGHTSTHTARAFQLPFSLMRWSIDI